MRFILNPFTKRLDAFEADISPAGDVETLTGDSGGAVGPDAAFNVSISGNPDIDVVGTPGTNSFQLTDLVKWTPYVVDSTAGAAPYSTIQAAITAAEATGNDEVVLVRMGTYTENLTFSTGTVDLLGAGALGDEGQIEIVGDHTPPASGHCVFRNFKISSPTDIFSSAAVGTARLVIIDALLNITNGYIFNCPNWAAGGTFECFDINDHTSTNDGVVNNTGGAACNFVSADLGNGVGNTMTTSGSVVLFDCAIGCPVNYGNGTTLYADNNVFLGTQTFAGNSTGYIQGSHISTGATQAITMSSSAGVSLRNNVIETSNNPSIGGAGVGTLTIANNTFIDDSSIATTVTTGYAVVTETGSSYFQECSLDRGTNHLKTSATGQTVGAVTSDLYTLSLGATPSAYTVIAQVTGYASGTSLSVGYFLREVVETTGVAASIIGSGTEDAGEGSAAEAAQAQIVVSGNDVIVRATGIAGSTFNWRCVVEWARVE